MNPPLTASFYAISPFHPFLFYKMESLKTYLIQYVNPNRVVLYDREANQALPPFPTLDIHIGSSSVLSPGMAILYHPQFGYMDQEFYLSLTVTDKKQEAGELVWLVFHLGKMVGLGQNRDMLRRYASIFKLAEDAESKSVSLNDVDKYAGLESQMRNCLQGFGQTLSSMKYQGLEYSDKVKWSTHYLASLFSICLVEVNDTAQVRHYPDTPQTSVPFLYYSAGGRRVDVSMVPHANLFPKEGADPRAVLYALEGIVVAPCAGCGEEGLFLLPCGDLLCDDCVKSCIQGGMIYCPKHQIYHRPELLKPQIPASFPVPGVCAVCKTVGVQVDSLEQLQYSGGDIIKLDCGDGLCSVCAERMLLERKRECSACGQRHSLSISSFPPMSCWRCEQVKPFFQFSSLSCPTSGSFSPHRLCQVCASSCLLPNSCRLCNQPYPGSERQKYVHNVVCSVCHQRKQTAEWFGIGARGCDCAVCFQCANNYRLETMDILGCPGGLGRCRYNQTLVRTLSQSLRLANIEQFTQMQGKCVDDLKSYELERRNWKKSKTCCPICTFPLSYQDDPQKVALFEVRTIGLCEHTYHKVCLTDYLQDELSSIVEQGKREYPKCPNPCGTDIDGNLISGRFPLVSVEISDKFNVYQAGVQCRLFQCACIDLPVEIPYDAKFVICPEGKEHCVGCKGLGNKDNHNPRNCQYNMKERVRVEFYSIACPKCEDKEKKGCIDCPVSQCPNCLEPCTKGGCDKVTCPFPTCRMDFCFRCSVLYKIIDAHKEGNGGLWHRPSCSQYPSNLSQEEINAKIAREEKKPECPECIKLGRRCDPPKDLLIPHRFSLEEWINQ